LYCILLKFATNVKAKKLVANQQLESFFFNLQLVTSKCFECRR
jgi:hypothetical protein